MITINLYYKGTNGNARAFAEEMESSALPQPSGRRKGTCAMSISSR